MSADSSSVEHGGPQSSSRELTVAKRPLANLPSERRTEIANILLNGYNDGKQIAEMAPQFGISDVTAYALLLREHEADWKEAQKARAMARLDRAQNELRTAPDALSLARAREEVRAAQWELERLMRRLYGQDAPQQAQAVQININLRRNIDDLSTGEIVSS